MNNLIQGITFHSKKPNNAVLGDIYYDDRDSSMYVWNGKWVKFSGVANVGNYLIDERILKLDKIKKNIRK